MMTTACNVINCKYNGGQFCTKLTLSIDKGLCSELFDKNGQPRPASLEFVQHQMQHDTYESRTLKKNGVSEENSKAEEKSKNAEEKI